MGSRMVQGGGGWRWAGRAVVVGQGGAVCVLLRFVLFFDVVDVPVVLVVFWCLARYCARQGMWSRQCCPWCSSVAVLGPGGDMPVVATTGAVLGHG